MKNTLTVFLLINFMSFINIQAQTRIDSLSLLGEKYFHSKDYLNSLVYFNQAREIDSMNPNINLWIAYVLRLSGDTLGALRKYNFMETNKIMNTKGYEGRGFIYEIRNQYTDAVRDYKLGIELEPNNFDIYSRLGGVYLKNNSIDSAMILLTKSIEMNKNFYNAYSLRGVCKTIKGDYKNGIIDYTKALKINPNFDIAYVYRAMAYAKLGKFRKAHLDMYKASLLGNSEAKEFMNKIE